MRTLDLSFLALLLTLTACSTSDECRAQTDDLPLIAAWYDGDVQLAHEPPLLQIIQSEIYWTLPHDATNVRMTLALSDLAPAPVSIRTSVSELDLQDRLSTSEPYTSKSTFELRPDEVVTIEAPLSIAPRPKSFVLAHESAEPMRVLQLAVDRLVCS